MRSNSSILKSFQYTSGIARNQIIHSPELWMQCIHCFHNLHCNKRKPLLSYLNRAQHRNHHKLEVKLDNTPTSSMLIANQKENQELQEEKEIFSGRKTKPSQILYTLLKKSNLKIQSCIPYGPSRFAHSNGRFFYILTNLWWLMITSSQPSRTI